MNYFFSLFISSLFLVNILFLKKVFKTWFLPASLYSFFWLFYTFTPLVFLPNLPVNPLAITYIYVSSIFFTLPTFLFKWTDFSFRTTHTLLNQSLMLRIFYVISVGSVICFFLNSIIQGFSIQQLVFNLFESAAMYAEKRYSEEIESNIYNQISNVFMYTSLALGGMLFVTYKRKRYKILFLSFLTPILILITQSSKGSIFLAGFLFLGGYFIFNIYLGNRIRMFKIAKKIILPILVLFPLLIISIVSRGLYNSEISFILERLSFNLYSYSFGHLFAFSDWFSFYTGGLSINTYKQTQLSFGFYTFMPIFQALGDSREVPLGVFDEYIIFPDVLQTNIYTWFRGLIIDFGILGSCFFLLVAGYGVNFLTWTLTIKRLEIIAIATFPFILGFIFSSFIISLLIWKSVYASCFLLLVIMKIVTKKFKFKYE